MVLRFPHLCAALLLLRVVGVGAVSCLSYTCQNGNQPNSSIDCPISDFTGCQSNTTENEDACCGDYQNACTLSDRVECDRPCYSEQECSQLNCRCANNYTGGPALSCQINGGTFDDNCAVSCSTYACREGVNRDAGTNLPCINGICEEDHCCLKCSKPEMPLYNETLFSPSIPNRCVDCRRAQCPPGWTRLGDWYDPAQAGWYAGAQWARVEWKGWDSSFSCCYQNVCSLTSQVTQSTEGVTEPKVLGKVYKCKPGYAGEGIVSCPSFGSKYTSDCANCVGTACQPDTLLNSVCSLDCNTTKCCIQSCIGYTCPVSTVNRDNAVCPVSDAGTCTPHPRNNEACCKVDFPCSTYSCSAGWHKEPGSKQNEMCNVTSLSGCVPNRNDEVCCEENVCHSDEAVRMTAHCRGDLTQCSTVSECGNCTCNATSHVPGRAQLECRSNDTTWIVTGCQQTCGAFDCSGLEWRRNADQIVCGDNCKAADCCACPGNQKGTPPLCSCTPPYRPTRTPPYCEKPPCSEYTCPLSHSERGSGTCEVTDDAGECKANDQQNTDACCIPFVCVITEDVYSAVDCTPSSDVWYPNATCRDVADETACVARPDCLYRNGACSDCSDQKNAISCTGPKCNWKTKTPGSCVSRAPCKTVGGCGGPTCKCRPAYKGTAELGCFDNGSDFTTACRATCEAFTKCHPKRNYLGTVSCPTLASSCDKTMCCYGSVDRCSDFTCPAGWLPSASAQNEHCKDTTREGACKDDVATWTQCCTENLCAPLGSTPERMICQANVATCRNSQECQCSCAGFYVGKAVLTCPSRGGIIKASGCNETCSGFTCSNTQKDIIKDPSFVCSPKCTNEQCCTPNCPPNSAPPQCECAFPYHAAANISWYDYDGPAWCILPSCSTYSCPALHKQKADAGACVKASSVTECEANNDDNTRACCDEYWVLYEPGTPGVHMSRNIKNFDLNKLKSEVVDDLGLECGDSGVAANIDWRNSPPGKVVFALEVDDSCKPSSTQTRCVVVLASSPELTTEVVAEAIGVSPNRIINFAHLDSETTFTLVDRSGKTPDTALCTKIHAVYGGRVHVPPPPTYHLVSVGISDGNATAALMANTMQISISQIEYFDIVEGPSLCRYAATFMLEAFVPLPNLLARLDDADFVCRVESKAQGTRKGFKGRILGAQLPVERVATGLQVPKAQVRLEKNMEFSFETREEPMPGPEEVARRLQEEVGVDEGAVVVVEDLSRSEVTLREMCRLKFEGMDCPPTLRAVVTTTCRLPATAKKKDTDKKYHYTIAGLASLIAVAVILYRIIIIARRPPMREHSLSLLSTEMTEIETITAT